MAIFFFDVEREFALKLGARMRGQNARRFGDGKKATYEQLLGVYSL
jgi:hypothetical protein